MNYCRLQRANDESQLIATGLSSTSSRLMAVTGSASPSNVASTRYVPGGTLTGAVNAPASPTSRTCVASPVTVTRVFCASTTGGLTGGAVLDTFGFCVPLPALAQGGAGGGSATVGTTAGENSTAGGA